MKYISRFNSVHKGKDIYIIGTGPSLRLFPLSFFKTVHFIKAAAANYPKFSFFHYLIINAFLLELEAKYGFKKTYKIY